jgi:hypothetical protein
MENTAKNFALQLGALIALYVSIGALVLLLFSVINVAYPDLDRFPWEAQSASSAIRGAIAALIVFFPAYLALTRIVNKSRRMESGAYTLFTKWLIYLSLVIGGGVLLGDLVTVINNFLNGELTTRFILKALSVFAVVGAAFAYYVFDARNYWQTHEKESKRFGYGVILLVVIALVLGFMNTESPAQVRERSIDDRVISDLEGMQTNIQNYYMVHNALPAEAEDAYNGLPVPAAPKGRAAYSYEMMTDTTFKICGEFSTASPASSQAMYAWDPNASWDHGAGAWCFERAAGKPMMNQ